MIEVSAPGQTSVSELIDQLKRAIADLGAAKARVEGLRAAVFAAIDAHTNPDGVATN